MKRSAGAFLVGEDILSRFFDLCFERDRVLVDRSRACLSEECLEDRDLVDVTEPEDESFEDVVRELLPEELFVRRELLEVLDALALSGFLRRNKVMFSRASCSTLCSFQLRKLLFCIGHDTISPGFLKGSPFASAIKMHACGELHIRN